MDAIQPDLPDDVGVPCVIYAAKSTEDKRGSIPTQLDDGRAMAVREGWKIVAEHKDEGFSGYTRNRGPGLEKAKRDAANAARVHGRAMLVVQHTDRLARGAGDAPGAPEHLAEIMFWARRHNVALRSVQDDSNLTNPLLAFVIGERNHEDSRRNAASIKDGLRRRAQRGQYHGAQRAYGYDPGADGRYVPRPDEAAVYRQVVAMYETGMKAGRIARELTNKGIRTRKGRLWSGDSIDDLLANPVYKGAIVHKGEIVAEHAHEPLIDPDRWERVQQLRRARKRLPSGGRGRPSRGLHLLVDSLLRCGHCGSPMRPYTPPERGVRKGTRQKYRCNGHERHGAEFCPQLPVDRETIDTAFWSHFERVGLDVNAMLAATGEALDRAIADSRAERGHAERLAMHALSARADAERAWLEDGTISAAQFSQLAETAETAHRANEAKAEQLRRREEQLTAERARLDAEGEVREQLESARAAIAGAVVGDGALDSARAAVVRLFQSVTVRPDGPHRTRTAALVRRAAIAADHHIVVPEDRPEIVLEARLRREAIVTLRYVTRAEPDTIEIALPAVRREPLHRAVQKAGLIQAMPAEAAGKTGWSTAATSPRPSSGATIGSASAFASTE